MMDFIRSNITFVVTTLTLISNIVFVLKIFLLLVEKKFRTWVYVFVDKNVLSLLFVTTLGALIGSLVYSNIVGFPPCELCWIQRILMYPQTILLFMAMRRKDKNIVTYLLPLSILGAIVSLYHSLVQWGLSTSVLGCTAVGGECAKVYVLKYGYITIPFMSFSIFVYLIAISVIYYKARNARE